MTTTRMMTIRATTSAATTPATTALFSPDGDDGDVGSGCTSVGDDTGKEEMRWSWFSGLTDM